VILLTGLKAKRGFGEHGFHGYLLLEWERADILPCTSGFDAIVIFHGWGAKDVEDESQLVVICTQVGTSEDTEKSRMLTVFARE